MHTLVDGITRTDIITLNQTHSPTLTKALSLRLYAAELVYMFPK